jgi:hypothetical protein
MAEHCNFRIKFLSSHPRHLEIQISGLSEKSKAPRRNVTGCLSQIFINSQRGLVGFWLRALKNVFELQPKQFEREQHKLSPPMWLGSHLFPGLNSGIIELSMSAYLHFLT